MTIDGTLLLCRKIAIRHGNLLLGRIVLYEAHVLQCFVLWERVADLTRLSSGIGTSTIMYGALDVLYVQHSLAFSAVEYGGIGTVKEAILSPVDDVLVSLPARGSEFYFYAVARNISLADWFR